MAFVTLIDAPSRVISKKRALYAWEVLQGRTEPENKSDELFISRIKRLYLNREYAPADYNAMYPQPITENVQKEQKLAWYQK